MGRAAMKRSVEPLIGTFAVTFVFVPSLAIELMTFGQTDLGR
jgi:hypothetical protein